MTMEISINHTTSGRWRYHIRGMGEEKVVVVVEENAILKQLVQSYLVLQIERISGQPNRKQFIKVDNDVNLFSSEASLC